MKCYTIPLVLVFGGFALPVAAQNQNPLKEEMGPITVGTHLYAPQMQLASVTPATQAAPAPPVLSPITTPVSSSALTAAADGISLASFLRLTNTQIDRLNRLYNSYAKERIKQEKMLDEWQIQLEQAQAPATFDEKKSSRITRDMNKGQQKVADTFFSTRSKSLAVLTETQRIQVRALASDSLAKVRGDQFYQLLLLPATDFWRVALDPDSERSILSEQEYKERRERNPITGNYGVYGGYGYGRPQYGIYGGIGRDGVGVQVGIGRGGPSFGINIGNVFRIGR